MYYSVSVLYISNYWSNKFSQLSQLPVKRKNLLDLSTDAEGNGNRNTMLTELMAACVSVVNADGGHLYVYDKDTQVISDEHI